MECLRGRHDIRFPPQRVLHDNPQAVGRLTVAIVVKAFVKVPMLQKIGIRPIAIRAAARITAHAARSNRPPPTGQAALKLRDGRG
jgi:hypothetical protein